MKYDHNFAQGEPAPADLALLLPHIYGRISFHTSRRPRLNVIRGVLHQGSRIPARLLDLHPAHAFQFWHGGPRNQESFASWIGNLVMPAACAEARDDYIDALELDDPEMVAETLMELEDIDPEVVTALLELRIGRAYDLMISRGIWSYDRLAPEPADARDYILRTMFHVWIARWLRTEAVLCASKLRRPLGWHPLDHADRPDMVRYGVLHRRYMRELRRVEEVIKLYRSGAGSVGDLARGDAGAWLETVCGVPSWHEDLVMSDARSQSQWDGIVRRAEVQLEGWQARHEHEFKPILDQQIRFIELELFGLRAQAEERWPTGTTFNMRVANERFVDPLAHLYHPARFAVAWTRHPVDDDHANTDAVIPIEQALKWLKTAPSNPHDCPHPAMEKNDADAVVNVFNILRFAIVSDDNMVPWRLRSQLIDNGSGQPKVVQVTSQFQAARVRGRPFTFEELYSAFLADPKRRCEVRKRVNVRKNKALSDFEWPMHGAVRRSLGFLAGSLTVP